MIVSIAFDEWSRDLLRRAEEAVPTVIHPELLRPITALTLGGIDRGVYYGANNQQNVYGNAQTVGKRRP